MPKSSPWHEIPAWPFVVPLTLLAGAVLLWRLHRRAALTIPRALVVAVLCVYGGGVLANSLFPIFIGKGPSGLPWWDTVNLTPLVGTDRADMLRNVVVFLPLGFLLPLVARIYSARRVLLYGFLLSLAIETIQLVQSQTGNGGHVADINDLLANTLGAPIGYGIFRALLLLPALARLATAATWPPSLNSKAENQPSL
jgi:VanZ family protein